MKGASNLFWYFELCHIFGKLGNFTLNDLMEGWLEAGYVENDIFFKTLTRTWKGRIISPLLANRTLDGMEEELGIEYRNGKCVEKYIPKKWKNEVSRILTAIKDRIYQEIVLMALELECKAKFEHQVRF